MRTGIGLALPLLLPLAACDISRIDVINGTRQSARDVEISGGGRIWKLGDIPPGRKVTFRGHMEGEGGVLLSWTVDGRRFTQDSCYFTGGFAAKGSVTIVGQKLDLACH